MSAGLIGQPSRRRPGGRYGEASGPVAPPRRPAWARLSGHAALPARRACPLPRAAVRRSGGRTACQSARRAVTWSVRGLAGRGRGTQASHLRSAAAAPAVTPGWAALRRACRRQQARVAVAVLTAVGTAVLTAACSGSTAGHAGPQVQHIAAPAEVSGTELARLPRATTYASIPAAPGDPAPFAATGGLVVHPLRPQIVYAGPGKRPVAVLPATELGSPTWVPVVQRSPGWERVLLPSRPNRATGWIYTAGARGPQLDTRRSAYLIRISTAPASSASTTAAGDASRC